MSINITYIDYKPLTGLQGRGVLRASSSSPSGIIPSYRSGLNIEVPNLAPSTIELSSGGLLVDTTFVENTDTFSVPTTADGSFILVCEVNLSSDSATFKLVTSITSQDNLTASNTGVYQLELARIVRAGGIITSINVTATYIVENIINYLQDNYSDNETLVANFRDINNTRDAREIQLYSGVYYLENGQTIVLAGGRLPIEYESMTFIFSRYSGGAVNGGGGQVTINQFNSTNYDGFYNEQSIMFNIDLSDVGGTAVNTAIKVWKTSLIGRIEGLSVSSSVNKKIVLRSIVGVLKEEFYEADNRLMRSIRIPNYPTVPSSEVPPDTPMLIMANETEAYDFSKMSEEDISNLKAKLGIVEEVINDEQ